MNFKVGDVVTYKNVLSDIVDKNLIGLVISINDKYNKLFIMWNADHRVKYVDPTYLKHVFK